MKTRLTPQTLTQPDAFCTPRAVAAAVWASSVGQDRDWYQRELSVEELTAAAATVNARLRATRR